MPAPFRNGSHSLPSHANNAVEQKQAVLSRLEQLRSWLDRQIAGYPRPGADRAALQDLARIVNILMTAEQRGRSNLSVVWPQQERQEEPLPSEVWLG